MNESDRTPGAGLRAQSVAPAVAQLQRRRLLLAAAEAAASRGLAGLTVGDIVAGAGVSRRTFYLLFADRDDCLNAAVTDALRQASAVALDAYGGGEGDWIERVRAALLALLCFCEREPPLARLLVVESFAASEPVLSSRVRALERAGAALDAATPRQNGFPLVGEAVAGGLLWMLYRHLREPASRSALDLLNPMMGIVALAYGGREDAARELRRAPVPSAATARARKGARQPRKLQVRITYRTVRVLQAVAEQPGASNRRVSGAAGIADQGQASRLLARLRDAGLIENTSADGGEGGSPNAWRLSSHGWRVWTATSAGTAYQSGNSLAIETRADSSVTS